VNMGRLSLCSAAVLDKVAHRLKIMVTGREG
jgi:hypothetical protein